MTTNQTTELTTNQVVRHLTTARNAQDATIIQSLTAELTNRIIINAAYVEALAEDEKRTEMSMTMEDYAEMKDREWIAADCDAMKTAEEITTIDFNSKLAAAMSTVVVELAHREALTENDAIQSCPCLPSSLCYRYACPKYAAKHSQKETV